MPQYRAAVGGTHHNQNEWMLPLGAKGIMKKNLKFAKPLVTRLLLAVMLLAVLASVFVGCAGPSQTTINVTVSEIEHDEAANGLTKLELKTIAEFLAGNASAREAFVAAYRGYDMTEKNFDLEAERPQLDPSVEAAKNVLKKFDEKGKNLGDVDYSAINEADMLSIINAMKSDVDIEGKRGFMDSIQYGIGVVLAAITKYVGFGNYLVGICLFAIVVEIVMLPFSIKQQKNSIKQAMLRPKEMAIRKKYAGRNDQPTQQKIQQEIQELYQRENFNPMGGCLPMLIQFPIIIILYNIVVDPIRYLLGFAAEASTAITTYVSAAKAAGGLGHAMTATRGTIEALSMVKEKGLSAFEGLRDFLFFGNGEDCFHMLAEIESEIPSFNIGALNCGLIPSFTNWLWVVPVLTFGVYFASMKLSRKMTYQPTQANDPQQGCSNNMMDITMPLMSVYIAFITPAVIGIYWIFRSILNTLKQFIMSKVMPLPRFTEEDYKAAEKEMKARSKGQPTRTGGTRTGDGTKPRSLHHIDDDDELPPPTPKKADKKPAEKKEEVKEEPVKEVAPETTVDQAPLKDETDKPQKND